MTIRTELKELLNFNLIARRALIGAGLACVLLALFVIYHLVFDNLHLRPEIWVPFLTIAIGGASGGIFYSVMDIFRKKEPWKKVMANIISGLVYCLALWMSLVYGLYLVGLWH